MNCIRCENVPAKSPGAYCDECRAFFAAGQAHANERDNPIPGVVHAVGKFRDDQDVPQSFFDGTVNACGFCENTDLEMGYGYAGGFGLGSYYYCPNCHAILDFMPDTGE